jgi:hypothetical protein
MKVTPMLAGSTALLLLCHQPTPAQTLQGQQTAQTPASELLHWPLSSESQKYAAIDGKHIWQYVVQQAHIAEDYRDSGHSQFWGRISGTSSDLADARWLLSKYQQIGLSDTHIQTISYFAAQWSPKSWNIAVTSGDKTVQLTSAQPSYGSPATNGKELRLELAYVGLGSDADFASRDVRGKAVLIVRAEGARYEIAPAEVLKRAEDHGAAAIFSMDLAGGNLNAQSYQAYTSVPSFNLGTADGGQMRELIGSAPANHPPQIKIRMDAEWVPNEKSYLVWGSLPGTTDETVYVIAHRDGWFDGAGDNASGVASMLGLAEYFAKVPQSQRRRTLIFIGTDGHHDIKPGGFGREWMVANRDKLFAKTALMINDEHPSEVLTHGGASGWTDTMVPLEWYAGGSSRPQLRTIAADAFREFGVPIWAEAGETPPAGDLGRFYWFLPGLVAQSNDYIYMHTIGDTPDNVLWTGLEAVTRAYAKIIDDVNQLPLAALQRPASADPNAPGSPRGYISLAHCAAWIHDSANNCVQ